MVMDDMVHLFTHTLKRVEIEISTRLTSVTKAFSLRIEDFSISEGTVNEHVHDSFDALDYAFHLSNQHQQRVPAITDLLNSTEDKMKSLFMEIADKVDIIKKTTSILSDECLQEEKELTEGLKYYKKMKKCRSELQSRISKSQKTHNATFLHGSFFKKGIEEKVCETQINNFEEEFKCLLSSVNGFEYYNHVKKNLNMQGLEKEFEKLEKMLQTLTKTKDLYEDCFCSNEQGGYDMKTIVSGLNTKFESFSEEVKKEAEDIFANLEYKSEDRVTLYKNLVELFGVKRYRFI